MDLAGVCKDVVYHKNLIKLPQVKKKKKKKRMQNSTINLKLLSR